jgi:hypothetical protein
MLTGKNLSISRYTVRFKRSGLGLTSFLAEERKVIYRLSHITAKENIYIFLVHKILLL